MGALRTESKDIGTQPNLPKPLEVSCELSCDEAARIIKEWLAACESHGECTSQDHFSRLKKTDTRTSHLNSHARGESDWRSSYPERLIWLGPNVECARLIPFPRADVQYAALSYWFVSRSKYCTVVLIIKS